MQNYLATYRESLLYPKKVSKREIPVLSVESVDQIAVGKQVTLTSILMFTDIQIETTKTYAVQVWILFCNLCSLQVISFIPLEKLCNISHRSTKISYFGATQQVQTFLSFFTKCISMSLELYLKVIGYASALPGLEQELKSGKLLSELPLQLRNCYY